MRSFIKLGGTLLGFLPVHTLAFHLEHGHVIRKRVNCFRLTNSSYTFKAAPGEKATLRMLNYPVVAINHEKTRWRFGWEDADKFEPDK